MNIQNQITRRANVFGKFAVFALLNSLLVTAAMGALPDISINFPGCCNNDGDPLYSTPTTLLPTDVAGVVARGNWNNVSGNSVHDAALNDSNGAPTTVTIFYDADESWGSNAGKNTPDQKLLNGYLGISNDGHYRPLFLNNVPNGAYKLIMYNGRGDNQPQGYTVNPASVNTHLSIMPQGWTAGGWDGVWIRGTSTDPNARDVCNYVQFDEVAPVNGTITIDCRSESFRGMMNGIQLLPLAPGAFRFVNQPANAVLNEGSSVSFYGGAVDGVGALTYQWLTNGVPDTSNLTRTYNRSNLAVNESGRTFALVATDSNSQSVTSRVAVLTVNSLTTFVAATSNGRTNRVYASFGANIALTGVYTLNNGATVFSASYGATHKDIVLNTSILVDGATYTLTATGETREDNGDPTVPNPNTITFIHGFGRLCSDFATLPAGTALYNNGITGSGYLGSDGSGNSVVHLTDDGNNGAYGKLFISNRTGGSVLKVLDAHWRYRIGGDLGGHADGVSFNWADNLASDGNFVATEEGEGTGVSFIIDTWDGGSGPDTGIEIKWQANRIAFLHIPRSFEGDANFLCKDVFVDSSASVNSVGLATFSYNGNTISATIPGWTGIANGTYVFSGRTGGENDNFWVDDLCLNNFTLGPLFFTLQPVTTTGLEGLTATFTTAVDGSPSYFYQWYTNGVAIPGATSSSYTTPPLTAAYEGRLYSVVVSNEFSSVTSSNAPLHVQLNPRVVTVFSQRDNEVHVIYTRPVDLFSGFYDLDNGVFEQTRQYGSSHSEVVVITDPLTPNTTYTLTVTDVADEFDGGSVVLPNPTIRTFRHGYGSICTDFAGVPSGASISGSAVVSGGILHITDAANSLQGNFFLPDQNGGQPMDRLVVSFKTLIGSPTPGTRIADGMSFNVAPDINAGSVYGEEGLGSGLTITFDTWDNNVPDTAPAIEVHYKGATVAVQAMSGITEGGRAPSGPFLFDANGNPLSLDTSNQFANVLLMIAPNGKLDFYFKNQIIFQNLQLPNYTPFVGAGYGFGARTGGANENAWIDDLCINNFSLGDLSITQQPADATAPEIPAPRFTFSVGVDGLPPYSVQWYSNNVAIAGATTFYYTTPPLLRAANGSGYKAVITNMFGSITSRTAIVTIQLDTVAPTVVSATANSVSNVYVIFNEALDPATANTPGFYTINHGVTVTAANLDSSGKRVILTVSPNINPNDCDILTVTGVRDVSTFNVISGANVKIAAKAPIPAGGTNNLVVVEAEDYDINRSPGLFWAANNTANNSWVFGNTFPGYFGTGYMDTAPNNGGFSGNTADGITNALRLDYCINFPTSGTYYAWFRGASHANDGSRNSLHFGIDGVIPDEFTLRVGNRVNNWGGTANLDDFGWVNDANGDGTNTIARITVTNAGVHVINVWMREAGFSFDRFLLTTDSGFTLAAAAPGPATTPRPPTRSISLVRAPNGSVTISWPGAGWTLQATAQLSSNPTNTVWQNQPFPSGTVIPPGYFGIGRTNVFFRLICP